MAGCCGWSFTQDAAAADIIVVLMKRNRMRNWLEVPEPSATNLACVARLNLWGVEWRGDLVDLASKSHRVIRVVT